MSYREIPINFALDMVASTGKAIGLQQKIEVSDHSVSVKLTLPDQDKDAWDEDMFRHSNIFIRGYANPIKPVVNHNPELRNKDTVDLEESDTGEGDEDWDEDDEDEGHVDLISSTRYRDYMRQDLVSQLLTPQEQWKLLAYGILGLGILTFFNMVVMFWLNGGGPT